MKCRFNVYIITTKKNWLGVGDTLDLKITLSRDIHTHTPAKKSSANFLKLMCPFLLREMFCRLSWAWAWVWMSQPRQCLCPKMAWRMLIYADASHLFSRTPLSRKPSENPSAHSPGHPLKNPSALTLQETLENPSKSPIGRSYPMCYMCVHIYIYIYIYIYIRIIIV